MEKMKWYVFPKDILPMVLLSSQHPGSLGGIIVKHPDLSVENVSLGYSDDIYNQKEYIPPAIISLPREKPAEVMAWLRVYAPDTYPLSQFARVLKSTEIEIYDSYITNKKTRKYKFYFHRWSSLVLGEILAQGESDISLDALPLSRGQATYSHAISRVTLCHDGNKYKDLCIQRLKCLEADKNFVPRAVEVKDLEPVWDSVDIKFDEASDIQDLMDVFSKAYFGTNSNLFDFDTRKELLSDSIESRVLTFRKISNEVSESNIVNDNRLSSLKIAMAAFLVGRGTSHVFLLKSIARVFPSVYVWFGLIAGIIGPTCWEIDWARAVKGIEKTLRPKLNWSEPSQSDLSWSEYDWISDTFRNNSPFVELPKLLPRVLSIEIIPGAICQLRLLIEGSSSKIKSESNSSVMNELTVLKTLLSEFYMLAERTKSHISDKGNSGDLVFYKRAKDYYANKKRK